MSIEEIEKQIESEYKRTPNILNAPVVRWESINSKLCSLIFEREKILGKDYAIRIGLCAVRLGRKGGQSTSDKKARASKENGKKGGRKPKNKETLASRLQERLNG